MKHSFFILGLFMVLVSVQPALAHNPFITTGDAAPGDAAVSDAPAQTQNATRGAFGAVDGGGQPAQAIEPGQPSLTRRLAGWLLPYQRRLNQELSQTIREYKDGGASSSSVFLLLFAAFVYGMVHAAGPGHGKSVASAYVLSRGGTVRQAFAMGMTTGAVHAASAVTCVMAIKFVLESALGAGLEGAVDRMSQVSFFAIAVIGLFLLTMSLRDLLRKKGARTEAPEPLPTTPRGHLKVAAVSGLIPCPGASIVLFFSLALDVPMVGVVAVAAMSLGMGLTIAGVAMFTACCRGGIMAASSARPRLFAVVRHVFAVGGSALVFGLGAVLFWASLGG